MRPRLRTILLLLLAGAAVNVAVAWGCVVLVDYSGHAKSVHVRSTENGDRRVLVLRAFGSEMVTGPVWRYAESLAPRCGLCGEWSKMRASGYVFGVGFEEARGWPCRSFRCELTGNGLIGGFDLSGDLSNPLAAFYRGDRTIYIDGKPAGRFFGVGQRILPLRPVWRGLTINTLFYAALLWLTLFGSLIFRRHLRARRGRCPACGYPVGESAVCSECGARIQPARSVAE